MGGGVNPLLAYSVFVLFVRSQMRGGAALNVVTTTPLHCGHPDRRQHPNLFARLPYHRPATVWGYDVWRAGHDYYEAA